MGDERATVVDSRDLWAPRPPRAERAEAGRAAREQVPLDAHAEIGERAPGVLPSDILRADDADRVGHLIPIRYGRMAPSPFTYLRGSAAVMAADLANGPRTELHAQLCGDAHLSNFGLFTSPDRRTIFDINDFDETYPGPFEWDVKRLAASVVVAGRDNGFGAKACTEAARAAVRSYRRVLARAAELDPLTLFYLRFEFDDVLKAFARDDAAATERQRKARKKAATRNSVGALGKLTEIVDGRRRIVHRPPLIERLDDEQRAVAFDRTTALIDQYRQSMPADRRVLLDRYSLSDLALRVGGVGSVGTRCFIALFESGDGDPLFLQMKEASPSVIEPHVGPSPYAYEGERVVSGQQVIQGAPDALLGWGRFDRPPEVDPAWGGTGPIDFYFRQLWDGKYSIAVESLDRDQLERYARTCGATIARAHARSGDASMISGYLGTSSAFDKAVTAYAFGYADRTEEDHAEMLARIADGSIIATRDV